jgi:hypothetical protein
VGRLMWEWHHSDLGTVCRWIVITWRELRWLKTRWARDFRLRNMEHVRRTSSPTGRDNKDPMGEEMRIHCLSTREQYPDQALDVDDIEIWESEDWNGTKVSISFTVDHETVRHLKSRTRKRFSIAIWFWAGKEYLTLYRSVQETGAGHLHPPSHATVCECINKTCGWNADFWPRRTAERPHRCKTESRIQSIGKITHPLHCLQSARSCGFLLKKFGCIWYDWALFWRPDIKLPIPSPTTLPILSSILIPWCWVGCEWRRIINGIIL